MESVTGRHDNGAMRRTGRSALIRGLATLAVMAAGIVVVATRGTTPIAQAGTVIGSVVDAQVVTPSGSSQPALSGQTLSSGEVITTGDHGSAELVTRGRLTLLGANAALEVIDGARQQLRTGTAVVDSLQGPGLALDLAGDTVAIPHGSATEAARGVTVTVGALSGPAAITSANGRVLALTSLSQAVTSGAALPAATTPLHLSDSANEARVVPRLVADDLALNTLASGIDTTGRVTARVVESSWTGSLQPVPAQGARSERVLPVLIADSTSGGSAQQRYSDVVTWRAEGGSWGVVVHLLSGSAAAVEATLAALQRQAEAPGRVGNVAVFVTSGDDNSTSTTQQTHTPGGRHPRHGAPPGGSSGGSPPPPTLTASLVATVRAVVNRLLGLLPRHNPGVPSPPAGSTSVHNSGAAAETAVTSVVGGVHHKTGHRAAPTRRPVSSAPATGSAGSSGGSVLGNLIGGLLH